MADEINEQLKKSYDDEGRAQLDDFYTPSVPSGVSPWVAYTGQLPDTLRFADDAPATLLAVQVWDSIPTKTEIVETLGEVEKAIISAATFSGGTSFVAGSTILFLSNAEGPATFPSAVGVGFSGKKNARIGLSISGVTSIRAMGDLISQTAAGRAVFGASSAVPSSGQKAAFGVALALSYSSLFAGSVVVYRAPYVGISFSHAHTLGIGGRKIFSYSQIQEADVATIYQGGRVPVRFVQGESVERNTFFFMPDGITPIADLSTYEARMDLREYPDDPTALLSMSSEDGSIFLSDTGLIVWEIPGSVTKDFNAITFGGDLFVHAPDGDAIMVCGFDFEMTISHTRGV